MENSETDIETAMTLHCILCWTDWGVIIRIVIPFQAGSLFAIYLLGYIR